MPSADPTADLTADVAADGVVDPAATPRRWRSPRQADTVAALVDAGLDELREVGGDQLTIRSVAQRAGLTHTTAYTYFTSKAHLIAEIHWRRLQAVPDPTVDADDSFAARVRAAFAGHAAMLADEPALAQAAFSALMSAADPDVSRLRVATGAEIVRRLQVALGDRATRAVVEPLMLAYTGAMLVTGIGDQDYAAVVDTMAGLAELIDA